MRLCVRPQSHIIDLTMGKVATTELNAEIVKAAEETVSLALQHLGKALDYSTNSLEDVEALIQHVKSRLSQLSKEENQQTKRRRAHQFPWVVTLEK